MSVENNKATVRRYFEEAKNQGNLDLLKDLARWIQLQSMLQKL
jgi:hypothetical protein